MTLTSDSFLYILALVMFGLGTFNAVVRINPIAAGLFCLTLAFLF